MSAAEISHRVLEKYKKISARKRLEGWSNYKLGVDRVPTLPGLRAKIISAPQSLHDKLGSAANRVLVGEFHALGVDWPPQDRLSMSSGSIWRLDPVTKLLWDGSDEYCFDISYRERHDLGDIKYVWEFNRLQFLQPVAAFAAISRDPDAILYISQAIDSWHTYNPPFRGICWNSGIEVALRAISLLVVSSMCGQQLERKTTDQISEILKASLLWINRYPSKYSSANNHLIAEAAATFLIVSAFPEWDAGGILASQSRRVLEQECIKQILIDGAPAEQSPTYGAFTAEFLMLSAFVASQDDKPFSSQFMERLQRFSDFIFWISDENGNTARYGDDDEGRVLTTCLAESNYAGSIAAAIRGYLGQRSSLPLTRAELRDGIFGHADDQESRSRKGLKVFDQGGITVIRRNVAGRRVMAVFDHGPLGYLSIAAHGHADALSLSLHIDGVPVLVDPGTYLYHAGGAWRTWFRGTAAHNTLVLGSQDQSLVSGPFNWSHKAEAWVEEISSERDVDTITAVHNGYKTRYGVLHSRSLEVHEDHISIKDSLSQPTAQIVQVSFQFDPNILVELNSNTAVIKLPNGSVLDIVFDESGTARVESGESVGSGWFSPSFGLKVRANRLVWTAEKTFTSATTRINLASTHRPKH